eukprot:gb/GFBE01025643.1/.p1 GENE.gb/GFBE01025643.1/~~gb/GFBE01025643.1/.p1  ORF type:complete len:465 (+),score=91.20 gb/GFBE01025643.1/:1-1395(+)
MAALPVKLISLLALTKASADVDGIGIDHALHKDNQCEGDEQCSFNALQVKGVMVTETEGPDEEPELGSKPCLEPGRYYKEIRGGYNMPGAPRSHEKSQADCQTRCSATPGCAHFSFWNDGGCLLTSMSAYPRWHHGVVAGPATCGDEAEAVHAVGATSSAGAFPSTDEAHIELQGMINYQHQDHAHLYSPAFPALSKPSTAPLQSFYVYRATSGRQFPMENVNAANAEGVMWYLHNEIVRFPRRKFQIDRIVRFRVQYRAPEPLYEKGMNFGVRYAFDSGKCTGPGDCQADFGKYGHFVGCNLVHQFPTIQFADATYYGNPTWYSFPGDCSDQEYFKQTGSCKTYKPGGACAGTPTGTGDCTFSYEPAGFVMLDDVVGIKDYEAFVKGGGREYIAGLGIGQEICARNHHLCDKGIHIEFWNWKHSPKYNKWRVSKLLETFKKKYPGQVDLGGVPCDFKEYEFYH